MSKITESIEIGNKHRDFFDWRHPSEVLGKVLEELQELKVEIDADNKGQIYEEFADCFFTFLQLARHLQIQPEDSLDFANQKFNLRFESMLKIIQTEGLNPTELELESLEDFWQKAKKETKSQVGALLRKKLSK